MGTLTVILGGLAVWWLALSGLTAGVVRDTLRRQRRRLHRRDVLAVVSGPFFWWGCLLELTRAAREATAIEGER